MNEDTLLNYELANDFIFGRNDIKKNYDHAYRLLFTAAKEGHVKAMNNLGNMLSHGYGIKKNLDKAMIWYEKAAAEDNLPEAQNNLAGAYSYGYGWWYKVGLNRLPIVVKLFTKAAEQGLAEAQNNLGNLYYHGHGVDKDYEQARKWYEKSAMQDHPDAQNNLGNMYYLGNGVKKDYEKAFEWFRKSSDQGHSEAQRCLGYKYDMGYGVTKDIDEAVKLYKLSADQGNKRGQLSLQIKYRNGYKGGLSGMTLPIDDISFEELTESAENGDDLAQLNLAHRYNRMIRDDDNNRNEVIKWLTRSADNGNKTARYELLYGFSIYYGVWCN